VRLSVELCVVVPAVPEKVRILVTGLAVRAAVKVRIARPVPLIVGGLNLAVTPLGRPLNLRVIAGSIEPVTTVCTV
jgi:hypothetical protein